MKKSLIALAVMAAAGAASAQSSVTLFGIVDATIAYGRGSGSGDASKTQLTNSGYNSSRLGFRGTEDLGGGLAASFWLEGSLGNDSGVAGQSIPTGNQGAVNAADGSGLVFNRRSTVSLSGNWGEIRLGRDYTPTFWNLTIFDPFGTNGVGTTLTLVGPAGGLGAAARAIVPTGTRGVIVRASNDVGYFLPANLGGIYGQVNGWFGENNQNGAANEDDGRGWGGRIGYGSGPFNVAAAYQFTHYAATPVNGVAGGPSGNFQSWNIGGQWDFGMAKVMGHYTNDTREASATSGEAEGKGWLLGALVPVGAGEIRASYSQYQIEVGGTEPEAKQFALGYVHNLSKRTAIYTTVSRVKNENGSAFSLNGSTLGTGNNSTGFDLGIRHSF